MTAGDAKLASLAFCALTLTVAINLLAFQDKRAGTIETSALGVRQLSANERQASGDLGPALGQGATPILVTPPKSAANPNAATLEATNSAEITRGIQRELNTRGYEAGQPDGVAGLVTRAAIMAYEHDYGLALTATPGPDLLSRIVLGTAAPQSSRPSPAAVAEAESVIQSVKQQLATLGYASGKSDGKADGKLGEPVARAIREFELDQKLPESGRISGPLVSRLIRLQGQGAAAAKAKIKSAQK